MREHRDESRITCRTIQIQHDQIIGDCTADNADVLQQSGMMPAMDFIKGCGFDLIL